MEFQIKPRRSEVSDQPEKTLTIYERYLLRLEQKRLAMAE